MIDRRQLLGYGGLAAVAGGVSVARAAQPGSVARAAQHTPVEQATKTFHDAVRAGLDPLNPRDPRKPGGPLIPRVGWDLYPWSRWTFQHIREMTTTAPIWRRPGPVRPLPEALQPLGEVMVNFEDGKRSVNDFLERSFTDGFLVLHRGKIVFERYMNNLAPHRQHLLMSVTKAFTGTLTGILVSKGLLDVTKPVTHYLPELAATVYRGATVQHLLNMASGVIYDESLNEGSHMQKYQYAAYYQERVPGWPRTVWELILSLREAERPHGSQYNYRSIETSVVGFILQRVSGMSMADLLSQEIWAPMGAEEDAYIVVDDGGFGMASGGLCVTLRDFARFGQLLVEGGARDGREIVPQSWIKEIRSGRGAPSGGGQGRGVYHNFWRIDFDRGSMGHSGHGGQELDVEPDAEFAVVKFSSQPEGGGRGGDMQAAVHAIRAALS